MSTTRSRAASLRGVLVGGCAGLVTALVHALGGGEMPTGPTLVALVLTCATVGAGVGTLDPTGRRSRALLVILALLLCQSLGHVTLAVVGHHHSESLVTAPMFALHAGAAIGMGVLIGGAEYLYVVCSSVVSWLRRFATTVHTPAVASVHRPPIVVVPPPVPVAALGMRAPPRLLASCA